MATQSYNADDQKIWKKTLWGTYVSGNHIYFAGSANGSTNDWQFLATGTDISFKLGTSSTTNFQCSIDGGSYTTIAGQLADSVVRDLSVSMGSDAQHTVVLRCIGAGGVRYCPVASFVTVTGASPILSQITDTGPQYMLWDQTAFNTSKFRFDGRRISPVGTDYPNYLAYDATAHSYEPHDSTEYIGDFCGFMPMATVRRVSDCTAVYALMYGGNASSAIALFQDDVYVNTTSSSVVSPAWQWVLLQNSLSGSHEYQFFVSSLDPSACSIAALMFVGETTGSVPAARADWVFLGDSIVAGFAPTPAKAYAKLIADAASGGARGITNTAVVGSQLSGSGVAHSQMNRRANMATLISQCATGTKFLICSGTNDITNGVSAATYQADYITVLNAWVSAGIPASSTFYVLGIIPRFDGSLSYLATIPSYNTAIQAAIAGCSSPSSFTYLEPPVDVSNPTVRWSSASPGAGGNVVISGTDMNGDNLHPTDAGHARIAVWFAYAITPITNKARRTPGSPRTGSRGIFNGLSY